MSRVSIIIVSYHTGPALWLTIESALAQPECAELVLVDNGNVPGDVKRLRALAEREPRVKLMSGQGNVGFGKGCNLGAKAASGGMLLFLNPDCMLPEGGLARALAALERFPAHTLAGCFLANPDGSEQRGGRRALLTPLNSVAEGLGLHRIFSNVPHLNLDDTPMPEAAHEVPVISGAFMLLSRAFFNALGGFDEGYFLHVEDADLCMRVHRAGGKVVCLPEVKVVHFRSTSEAPSAFVEKHKTRGFIRYLKKFYGDRVAAPLLWLLSLGIWARYYVKNLLHALDRLFVPPLAGKQEVARLVLLNRLAHFSPPDATLAGRTILVTGASAQVGLSVIGKALARGARVIALYHNTKIEFTHPNLTWRHCDLADKDSKALAGLKADILVHAAGLWLLPPALPQWLEAGLGRVIAFSSTSVLGKADSHDRHEQEVVQKLETAEAEIQKLCAEKSVPVTLLRPTMIYGVGLDANITRIADVVRRFGFAPIHAPANGFRHPVQATELADAALAITDNPKTYGKTYSLGGSQSLAYRVMLEKIFAYLGKKPHIINVWGMPFILDSLGTLYQMSNINGEMARRMNRDLLFNIQDAMDDFGYHTRDFLEGEVVI